jgi:hypothetical protein
MNADLKRLIALQKLDTTADAARKQLAGEPEHNKSLDVRIDAAKAHVATAKEQLETNKAARRAIEKEVAVHQGRLSKFRETAMAVKTNVEYHAVQKEIAFAQTEIKTLEDKELELMVAADELVAAVKTADQELVTEQKAIDADRKATLAQHGELQTSLEKMTAERTTLVAGISKSAVATFEMVARKRNGIAVAEAKDGICTICHVRMRPQVFNTVLRNDEILQCDHCNRILYFVPIPASAASAPADPSPHPAS